jgi:RNA-binding protein YhbY
MTTENINIVLTNAQCCIGKYAVKVSKLLSINDYCADSEVVKLKLMNDYFEAACEYKNNLVELIDQNAIITLTTLADTLVYLDNVIASDDNVELIVNGISYVVTGDGTSTIGELIIIQLELLEIYKSHTVTYEIVDSVIISMSYIFELQCDTSSMTLHNYTDTVDGILIPGRCGVETTTTYDNCITPEEFEIVINKLMRVCEICPCQLT